MKIYIYTIDFCISVLYPATFINSFTSFNRFFQTILRIFYIKDHITCNQRQLYFFLSSLDDIIFSCLIALARTSSAMLDRNDYKRHFYFVPDLRKAFSLSSLNMLLSVNFIQMPFIMLRELPYILKFLKNFYHKRVLDYFLFR